MGDEGGDQNGALMSDPVDVIIEKLLRSVSEHGSSSVAAFILCENTLRQFYLLKCSCLPGILIELTASRRKFGIRRCGG